LTVSALERLSTSPSIINFVERPVTFSWSAVPGATSYVLEVGTTPGGADAFAGSTAGTSLTTTFPSAARVFPRVKAQNASSIGPPSADTLPLDLISVKDFTEALFFGTGPFTATAVRGCFSSGVDNTLWGWPPGTTVTITLASSLTGTQAAIATDAGSRVSEFTGGAIASVIRSSSNPHPQPDRFDLVVDNVGVVTCSVPSGGCAQVVETARTAVFARVRVLVSASFVDIPHEFGHAIYGMCHAGSTAHFISVMGGLKTNVKALGEADLIALQAVYAAGLRAGASRSDFARAGLIK
jgi:hypothetical protein